VAGRSQGRARSTRRGQGASRAADEGGGLQGALRWYAGGLVSGVFLSFMFYLVTLPPGEGMPPEPDTAAASTSSSPEPRFDFFEMLPQQRFEVEVDPESRPGRATESASVTYLLQAGSFRQAEDADRRRAELLLIGLQPRVEETNGSNGRWYRVLLGPFDSRSKMAAARSLTAQQNIDTLLLKRG
jgi:cell division septation protein DedD